jgi:LPPG:FO 2-phospho-L-lactate transferase
VSPIVEGRSLKGPTVTMMRSLGLEATALGVAREYCSQAAWFVLDQRDVDLEPRICELGYRVVKADTVMEGDEGRRRLAADILEAVAGQL